MSGVVTGLVTKVVSAATGTLARTDRHSNEAMRICANGTMMPTIIPSATPRGTERRVKRQSSDRSTRFANGRIHLLRSICSRVGRLRWIQAEVLASIGGGLLRGWAGARLAAVAQQSRLVALPVA